MRRSSQARRFGKSATTGIAVAAAAALVTVAGCSSTGTANGGASASTLAVGATLEPPTLDMTAAADASIPQALLYNVYETLVKRNSDGNLVGLLATQWQASDDKLTYTFTLQSNATFANGDPVNADAVVASINHQKAAKNAAIANQMADVASATATDDHTVEVKLKKPSQLWIYFMAGPAGIIEDPKGISTMATATAGSGPYQYASRTKGESLTLSRNTKYWGNEAHFSQVTFKYYTDASALTNAMSSGDVNVISNLTTPDALGQFSDTSKYTVTKGTSPGNVVLGFNNTSSALKNLKVREAITDAIDRKALVNSVWAGQGQVTGAMAAPTDPWFEDLSSLHPYSQATAKKLLAEAGYSKGLTLRLRVPTVAYATGAAQFIAAQLKQVGVTVKVEQLDFATWISSVFTKGDYDMTIVNHAEPYSILNFANPQYYWHYDSATFRKDITQADQATSTDTFVSLMKKADRQLVTDSASDFLFNFPQLVVTDADISGVSQNATGSAFDLTTLASSKS